MSTEQAAYALSAYDRFTKGENPLYVMSDAFVAPDNAGVKSVTVKGTAATAGANNTFTVALPYGSDPSTVTAADVAVKPLDSKASVTSDPSTADNGATWTFTVTATDGKTTASYTLQVSVSQDPASGNKADVAAAKTAISGLTYTFAMSAANGTDAVKALIENKIGTLSLNGVTATVTMNNLTAAIAGTVASVNGTSGSFTFTVNLAKGQGSTLATGSVQVSGTLTAIPYSGGATPPITPNTINVTFSLLGTNADGPNGTVNTLAAGNLTTWIPATPVTLNSGATVYDAFTKVLDANGYTYVGASGNYVSSITKPGGPTLAEFTNGKLSGWMYTVNGTHPNVGLKYYTLKNGDTIVWHYTDDYTKEEGSGSYQPPPSNPPTSPTLDQANKDALAALTGVTAAQQTAAALPASAPSLNPAAPAATVLTAADGVQLNVPSGALSTWSGALKVSVKIGQITTPPQAGSMVQVLDPLKYQRQFELENSAGLIPEETAIFTSPVILSFPIVTSQLPAGITTGQLAVYWWNPDKQEWVKLGGTYDPLTKTLSVPTYHFSTYAVMADTSVSQSLAKPPVISADTTDNILGKALDLTFQDDSAWRSAVNSVTVDGTVLPGSQYKLMAGDLQLLSGALTSIGNHIIVVKATGYNDSTVIQTLIDQQGTAIGKVRTALSGVNSYLAKSHYTSDWTVVGQGVTGQTIAPTDYLDSMVQTVNTYYTTLNNENRGKVTDLEKWTLSILAAGGDPRNIGGHDLISGIYNFYIPSSQLDITYQGLNSVIFGLIALDSNRYPIPENARYSRDFLISYLLSHQNSDGGWDLGATGTSDVDITGMTLQAMAPYYNTNPDVKTATDKALNWLSKSQRADGGFSSTGTVNSEAISQTIIALCANGIDPTADKFTKNGHTLLDALLAFQQTNGSFSHVSGDGGNDMATEQAYLALAAYDRFVKNNSVSTNGQTSIYYFGSTQTVDAEPPVISADTTDNILGKALDLTFQDDSAWRSAVNSVTVDGTVLPGSQYKLMAGDLQLL
ncbi:DUF1533 domain-containing protein, partial [Desulfosporosinus sp. PR]|uniref:hemoblobin-interacting domain-containing protein n=1 Tax=Candidatus Desulfosporosinus nitrosoreducens TaxID=3401928 RepID=UPI0027EE1C67